MSQDRRVNSATNRDVAAQAEVTPGRHDMTDVNTRASRMTRRSFMRRMGAIGFGATSLATLLAACGGGSSSTPTTSGGATMTSGSSSGGSSTAATSNQGAGTPDAATPSATESQQPTGKTLDTFTLADDIDPETLNPTLVNRTESRNIYSTIFDPLMHFDPKLVIQPCLAEKWEWVDDTTLRFQIRTGVKFHDGSDLTAADVKFTFEQAKKPESALAGNLVRVTSIEASDPQTVEIKVSEPDPLLLKRVVDDIYVIPATYFQKVGDDGFEKKPVGSGPFIFEEWLKSDHVTVKANESYWNGAPSIKTIVFKSIPEPTTRVSTVQSGGADLGTYVPLELVAPIKNDPSAELLVGSSPDALYIGMNPHDQFLANAQVRQAINYAIDTKAIATHIGGDDAKVLYGMILPGMVGYDESMQPYPYDPDKAKALLQSAGFAKGFEVVFDVPDGRVPSPQDTASIVASYLLEVGIKANIQVHAYDEFADYLYQRNGKVLKGLWYFHAKSSTLDPDDLLNPSFHSGGRWNWADYQNEQLDTLLDQAYQEGDETKRADLYKQITQLLKDEAYYVPLFQLVAYYVARKSDEWTWQPRPDQMVFIANDVKLT